MPAIVRPRIKPKPVVISGAFVGLLVQAATAQAGNGQLTFLDDVYGRDARQGATIAALR